MEKQNQPIAGKYSIPNLGRQDNIGERNPPLFFVAVLLLVGLWAIKIEREGDTQLDCAVRCSVDSMGVSAAEHVTIPGVKAWEVTRVVRTGKVLKHRLGWLDLYLLVLQHFTRWVLLLILQFSHGSRIVLRVSDE